MENVESDNQLLLQSRSTFIKSSIMPFLAIIGIMISYLVLEIGHQQESGIALYSGVKIALFAACIPYLIVLYRNMFRRLQAIKGQQLSLIRKSIVVIISFIPSMLIFLFAYLAIAKSKNDGKSLVQK